MLHSLCVIGTRLTLARSSLFRIFWYILLLNLNTEFDNSFLIFLACIFLHQKGSLEGSTFCVVFVNSCSARK